MTKLTHSKTASRLFSLCLLVFCLFSSSVALAWSTIPCNIDKNRRNSYPNGNKVWPLYFSKSMPKGSWAQKAIERAMELWNQVPGATTHMGMTGKFDYTACQPPQNAGYGVVMWDKGACFGWSGSSHGQTVYWTDDCILTKIVVAFNSAKSFTANKLTSTAIHELGHYQHYAHNWYELSTMGYHKVTTLPFLFLSARDHSFQRSLYPSTNASKAPDLHIHRFVQLAKIIPNQVSFDNSPPPSCQPHGCSNLRQGDSISVTLTSGNTGAVDTSGAVETKMFLDHKTQGSFEIGSWKTNGPIRKESFFTYLYKTTIPTGIPAGTYTLRVEINPGRKIREVDSKASAGNKVTFPGFTLTSSTAKTCQQDCTKLDTACQKGRCNPQTGLCEKQPLPDGTLCTDPRFCVVDKRCQKGSCVGKPRDCGANNDPCKRNTCDENSQRCITRSTDASSCQSPEPAKEQTTPEKTFEPTREHSSEIPYNPGDSSVTGDTKKKEDDSSVPPAKGCQCQEDPVGWVGWFVFLLLLPLLRRQKLTP